MKAEKVKYVLAMMLLISGLATVYFGNQFLDLQTGCTTFTFEWFEYKNELIISFAVFLFTTCFAVGFWIYEVIHPKKKVRK